MRVDFCIQRIPVSADLLVSEDIHEFMCGHDWLVAQAAHWFFNRGVLLLHGREIKWQQCTSKSYISRICAREGAIVSPYTAHYVAVKVV